MEFIGQLHVQRLRGTSCSRNSLRRAVRYLIRAGDSANSSKLLSLRGKRDGKCLVTLTVPLRGVFGTSKGQNMDG